MLTNIPQELDRFAPEWAVKLPQIVVDDVRNGIASRKARKNATTANVDRFLGEHCLRWEFAGKHIKKQYPFTDANQRKMSKTEKSHYSIKTAGKTPPEITQALTKSTYRLTHDILMSKERRRNLSHEIADRTAMALVNYQPPEGEDFILAMRNVVTEQARILHQYGLSAPIQNRMTEKQFIAASLRMQNDRWLRGRLAKLADQYAEYSQIALGYVGKGKGQSRYISRRGFNEWGAKMQDQIAFIEAMSVVNEDTEEAFPLTDVVSRTVSNQAIRYAEMFVRCRGFEELAKERGWVGIFVTQTAPSTYHRNSKSWNGANPRQAQNQLMKVWTYTRAKIKKRAPDFEYMGFRVAEPHKDGTPHAHYLLMMPEHCLDVFIWAFALEAIRTNVHELGLSQDEVQAAIDNDDLEAIREQIKPRIDWELEDPEKSGFTSYLSKYIEKGIDKEGEFRLDASSECQRVRAWASRWNIRQYQQLGGGSVTLWRGLRRMSAADVGDSEELHHAVMAADHSKWADFCKVAKSLHVDYEIRENDYTEEIKYPVGVSAQTVFEDECGDAIWGSYAFKSERYQLMRTSEVEAGALKKARRAAPWSTENNCNSDEFSALEGGLKIIMGQHEDVSDLIYDLQQGRVIAIDSDLRIKYRRGEIRTVT
ncbi:replication endonuclease [Thaumasiovibrio sp. DFM-14]|uniref:replication endonuclease n=1 Tax=Thaumasiovibrio sp. DFM-14 TaxID=3384792 RepID=UPI00399EF157